MNIYEKLAEITAELSAVAKNLTVGEGRSSYRAVGEADVLAAVKPLEKKHGVYSYPASREIVDSQIMVSQNYKGQEVQKQFVRIKTVYRFVNVEKPEEYIEVTTFGDGVDPQDKAPGKAMTYGDKYALLKAYKIITGEDPDQYMSEEGTFTKKEEVATPAQKKQIVSVAEQMGVDYNDVLRQVGFKEGTAFTVDQYKKAILILKGISDSKEA